MELVPVSLILIGISVLFPRTGALDKQRLDEPLLSGPSVALEGSAVDFFCEIPGKSASLQHDGRLVCSASGYNNTDIESSLSHGLDLKVIVPVKEVRITSHPSIDNLWEGQTLTLQCTKSKGTYVSYDWLHDGKPVEAPYDRTDGTLIIQRLSVRKTGHYMCVASNHFNDTTFNASDVTSVRVKEYVSKPELSLDVVKLEDAAFEAIITCRSEKGTPLITFSLLNNTEDIAGETSDRTSALFHVPIKLNHDMGRVRCNASNDGNWVLSEPINLTVESVGGAVTLTAITHMGRDFQVVGLLLRCTVERGTFPHYRWFLNSSRLEGRGAFYAVAWSDNSVLSLSVGRDSAGFYHCEASNSFDNSTSIRSPKMLINKEVLNRVPPLVVLVVLSCFALLNVTVMACCIYGVVLRRRYSRQYLLTEQRRKMKREDEEEDYLMLEAYEEDAIADRMSDSAQDEDESVDETLLYEDTVEK
ncbi:Fc receptor-like protein 5 isoform X2 [Pseudorasbora parva]|uniref:Fc receptor-like protein 5 isoform X2 n=1 Tax=Pseudorasbora parva TaxID=51549 RepID=UPI00351E3EF2